MHVYFSEIYPITKHISKPFRGEWGPGICNEGEFKSQFPSKAFLGELSLCIYEMQELCYQHYRSDEDRGRLRQELIKLFNADKVHWLGMNSDSGLIGDKKQEDPDYNGIQPYAVSV
ncbi:hypothetical protein [Pseudoalteromonas rubra]|uniref:hypothetical protein n=1 Tax=Pseudoalteromonas rubra TaxID=43658 RepID=UPI000F79AF82|nr:hypothetical protein [Pseudoalteromonas rubra]